MTRQAVQAAADQANREGRLHPSQRRMVLDGNFWTLVLVLLVLVALAVLTPIWFGISPAMIRTTNDLNAYFGKPLVSYWSKNAPLFIMSLVFLVGAVYPGRAIGRRLADWRGGKADVVTGLTHDFGHVQHRPSGVLPPMYLYEITERIPFTYLVVNGKSYRLDPDLRSRVLGGRANGAVFTPRSKILVNVVAA
ncbi:MULTISPECIES: hypothetical protein [Amycolatopsis]|uniref:Uncharacterized protein n=1 Tax=Amycolatopsis dendrobii TaxID=2760662 RepID=A0A7W3W249_9PSEU|nr:MULTISPECIES: hypothetical protein [Amycolatopsis]MBB1157360.1 hypothetical protein [Amycolatopsis dendrobii]UKD59241.1 hypothetical protein L3Q65_21785 [Amycolatopsis sp. FU40]